MNRSFWTIVCFLISALTWSQGNLHFNKSDSTHQLSNETINATIDIRSELLNVLRSSINKGEIEKLKDDFFFSFSALEFDSSKKSNPTYALKLKTYHIDETIAHGEELTLRIEANTYRKNKTLIYLGIGALSMSILLFIIYRTRPFTRRLRQKKTEQIKIDEREKLQKQLENFHFLGLTSIFTINDLDTIKTNQTEIYGILSYFATSLFDKNKLEEVLWDITKNCISKLDLEDCVIYWVENKTILVQKSAHGNKVLVAKKILNPIEIPIGKGIVGDVAQNGKPEIIPDVTKDKRYIVDDDTRLSELAVPIFLNGEVAGVIDSEHSKKDFFTNGHLKIFQLIAKLLEKKLSQISNQPSISLTNDNAYFKEFTEIMDKQKLYRDPLVSLVSVSNKLNISSGYLSRLINTLTGSNFNDYINSLRVNEVKSNLKNPAFDEYSILSIGLEAGFNSKSVFYAAFKKNVGVSPSEFRKNKS